MPSLEQIEGTSEGCLADCWVQGRAAAVACSLRRAFLMPRLGPQGSPFSFVLDAPPLLVPPSCQHPAQRAGSVPHPSASIHGTGTGQPTLQKKASPSQRGPIQVVSPACPRITDEDMEDIMTSRCLSSAGEGRGRQGPAAHQRLGWGSLLPSAPNDHFEWLRKGAYMVHLLCVRHGVGISHTF